MKRILLFVVLLGIAGPCFAKAYFAGKKEMIQKAECIALVNITRVEKADKKGKPWTYRQKASATVERCLKGDAKGEIEIYGMEMFPCAQCRYERGRFILFLRKEEGFWVGSNWNLGIRPVKEDKIQWFKDDKTRFEMKETPLDDVISEITDIVEEQKKETPNKASGGDVQAGKENLELNAFINDDLPECLVLDITNRGKKEVTVLTKGYALASFAMNDRKAPHFHFIFEIWTMEWPDAEGRKQRQTRVPSLPDLSPVTLRQDETAQITVDLDKGYQHSLADPDAVVTLIYQITERIAQRFGLWQGKIELRTTVAKLKQKTANNEMQPTK